MQDTRPAAESMPAIPCTYCGVVANTVDHVVPRWILARAEAAQLNLSEIFRVRRWTVPACLECNSALGNKIFPTLAERRAFVREGIRRRWAKFLRIPPWSEAELAELAPGMREHVEKGLRVQSWVQERLRWTGVGPDVELASVYQLLRRL